MKQLVALFSHDSQTVNRHADGAKHGNYWEEVGTGKSVAQTLPITQKNPHTGLTHTHRDAYTNMGKHISTSVIVG